MHFKTSTPHILSIALVEMDFTAMYSSVIALVTKSPFTHAMFALDGVWYDASESRNDFNLANIELFRQRSRLVFDIELSELQYQKVYEFIQQNLNRKYNWKGIFRFIMSSFNRRQKQLEMYCFQACYAVGSLLDDGQYEIPEKVTANHLKQLLNSLLTQETVKAIQYKMGEISYAN